MSLVKTRGIVIKSCDTGDCDKILTLFTGEYGKLTIYVKGAKKASSKQMASSQVLCYSEFILYKGKDMYYINSCELIDAFYNVRKDIIKLTYAAHMIDILLDVIQENQEYKEILRLFLNSVHYISCDNKNPKIITSIFELRLLSYIGLSPVIDSCSLCHTKEIGEFYFSFKNSGIICEVCVASDKSAVMIPIGVVKAIIFVLYADLKQLFSFSMSDENTNLFEKIIRRYLNAKLEKNYKKLDLIKEL